MLFKPPLVFYSRKKMPSIGLLIIGALIATWKWQKDKQIE